MMICLLVSVLGQCLDRTSVVTLLDEARRFSTSLVLQPTAAQDPSQRPDLLPPAKSAGLSPAWRGSRSRSCHIFP